MFSAFSNTMRQYAVFSGRTGRKEYWMFVLANIVISFVLSLIDNLLNLKIGSGETAVGILTVIYELAILIPGLALSVRRMHDVGKSGLFLFWSLVPCVGEIIVLIQVLKKGEPVANQYGEPVEF